MRFNEEVKASIIKDYNDSMREYLDANDRGWELLKHEADGVMLGIRYTLCNLGLYIITNHDGMAVDIKERSLDC